MGGAGYNAGGPGRRLALLYRMLAETNEVMLRASHPDELFDAACRIAIDVGGLRMAWIGMADAGTGELVPKAMAGSGVDYVPQAGVSLRTDRAQGRGPASVAAHTGRAVVCNDIAADPAMAPWHAAAAARGFLAGAAFPLVAADPSRAVLCVYSGEVGYFDDGVTVLLGRLVANIGYAWEKLHHDEDRLRGQARLVESSERFRQAFEETGVGSALLTLDGIVAAANPAFGDLFGLRGTDLVGRPVTDLLTPDTHDSVTQSLASVAAGSSTGARVADRRLRRYDGMEVWADTSSTVLRDPSGIPREVLVHAYDVTDRHRAMQELRDSEARLQTVLANVPLILFALDIAGRVVLFEGKGMARLGIAPEDVVGRTVEEIFARMPEVVATAHRALVGESTHGSLVIGDLVFEHWASPLLDESGAVTGVLGLGADVTEQAQAAAALQAREGRFRTLVHEVSDIIVMLDAAGAITYTSPAAERMLGYPDGSLLGTNFLELIPARDRSRAGQRAAEIMADPGGGPPVALRLVAADGRWVHVEAVINNLLDDPEIAGVVVVVRDITERRRAEKALAAQSRILEMIARGAPLDDTLDAVARSVETEASPARCSIHLTVPGDASSSLVLRASPSLPGVYQRAIATMPVDTSSSPYSRAVSEGTPVLVPDLAHDPAWTRFYELDAERGVGSCWSFPVLHPGGGPAMGAVSLYRTEVGMPDDTTCSLVERACRLVGIGIERERSEAVLAHQATHDSLTGLPNRTLLIDRIDMALERAHRSPDLAPVVVFLDLDRLKVVNDSLGHEAGDRLLIAVATRLRSVVRATDTVARFGGDEFVLVVEGTGDAGQPVEVADRALSALAGPVAVANRTVEPVASAGVVVAAGYRAASDVIRDADVAMYRAKHRGGGSFELFDPGMRTRAVERLDLEQALRRAITGGELRLHHQPIVDLTDNTVVGVESLVRWEHPERGLIGPDAFIGLAEETGLIGDLGRWVLDEASRTVGTWRPTDRRRQLVLNVNVSGRQLADSGLPAAVKQAVGNLGPPWTLCLELTESTLMPRTAAIADTLDEIRRLGVTLAIDDFGTGYSSLGYLTRLPVSTLKIDRSFVNDLGVRDQADSVAAAVIGLGRQLGLAVVAEGVETEQQLQVLRDLGCTRAQGYLFYRPLTPEAARAVIV